jgi:hypothetical protein
MHLVISRALVAEKEMARDDKNTMQQFPVYFMLEVLTGSKKYYSEMEKICYEVIMSIRKLRHYFEAHTIKVLTDQPLNDIFGNRDSSDRISKWPMGLSEYVVDFKKKRSAIKSQILANFVAEWTEHGSLIEGIVPESPWLVYCDRAWGSTTVIEISPFGVTSVHQQSKQIHQQYSRIQSHFVGPSQAKSHQSSNMHSSQRLKSCCQSNRKRVHRKRDYPQKILSPRQENGELFQRLYGGTH